MLVFVVNYLDTDQYFHDHSEEDFWLYDHELMTGDGIQRITYRYIDELTRKTIDFYMQSGLDIRERTTNMRNIAYILKICFENVTKMELKAIFAMTLRSIHIQFWIHFKLLHKK